MHEGASLHAGEYGLVDGFGVFFTAHDDTAPGSAEGLVGGGGYDIGIGYGAWIFAAGYEACEVSHIHHEEGSHFVGNGCHSFKVDDSGVSAGAADNEFRTDFFGCLFHSFVVQKFIFFTDTVGNDIEVVAGNIDRAAVGEMAAVGEVHAHHGISRFQEAVVYGKVCLGAGMGLYIDVFGAEEFFGPVNGQLFHLVYKFAAAVVSLARIAFSVLVCKNAALGFHHCVADNIFRSNHFQLISLSVQFFLNGFIYLFVIF